MGTLAFDTDRLRLLASALADAAERLTGVRSWDPEGAAPVGVAAGAATVFADWSTRLTEIASCGALSDYQPIAIDPAQLFTALDYVLASGYGWTTTQDPLGDEWQVPLVQQAAALGVVLSLHGAALVDAPDEFVLQIQLRQVLADPAALTALRANLSPAGAALLADRLSLRRTELVAAGGGPPGSGLDTDVELVGRVQTIDAIAGALASVVLDATAPVEQARATLATMRPYAAAMLVAHLDAPDETVAALAEATMRRYYDLRNDPQHWPRPLELPDDWSVGIGDLLFPRIAAVSPALANHFVVTLGSMSEELLTHTVHDPANAAAVLATATDPAVGAVAAAQVLVPLFDHLRDPGPYPDLPSSVTNIENAVSGLRPHLGALLAPWMVQFLDDQPAFGWPDAERDDVIRFVLAHHEAYADVLALVGSWGDSLPIAEFNGDTGQLRNRLDTAGRVIGELIGLLHQRRLGDALTAQAQWDLLISLLPRLAGKGIKYAGVGGIPAKVVVKVVNVGMGAGSDLAQEHGWLGAPPPLADVVHGIEVDDDFILATGSYLSAVTMRGLLVERGELAADFPDPPTPWDDSGCPSASYDAQLTAWLAPLQIAQPNQWNLLGAATRAFTAPGTSARDCQELQND